MCSVTLDLISSSIVLVIIIISVIFIRNFILPGIRYIEISTPRDPSWIPRSGQGADEVKCNVENGPIKFRDTGTDRDRRRNSKNRMHCDRKKNHMEQNNLKYSSKMREGESPNILYLCCCAILTVEGHHRLDRRVINYNTAISRLRHRLC